MIILVADTSVLIDLERGNLLQIALAGPDTLATPDLLYDKELAPYNGPQLQANGLQILELSGQELAEVQALHQSSPKLSIPDCAAYVSARRAGHHLLAGDGLLRQHAHQTAVPCNGLLWLLDRLLASNTVSGAVLHAGLAAISNHVRCRLPPEEVLARLAAWAR